MFTVINGVLLKPLSYAQPERLVFLQEQTDWSTQWGNLWAFTYPNYLDCRRQSSSLDTAAWRYTGGTLTEPGEADYVDGRQISSELFSVLGVSVFRGRGFRPEDDWPGAAPVAIISYGLWQLGDGFCHIARLGFAAGLLDDNAHELGRAFAVPHDGFGQLVAYRLEGLGKQGMVRRA